MSLTTFRHFCSAARVLDVYREPGALFLPAPELCAQLQEAVTLSLRTEYARTPDHQHRNRVRDAFKETRLPDMLLMALGAEGHDAGNSHCLKIDHDQFYVSATRQKETRLPDMLLMALGAVGHDAGNSHCLEIDHDQLYVRATRLEDWQREVTAYQSPVPIMAAAWARHCEECGYEETVGMARLQRALAHSTLPGINDRRFQNLLQGPEGGRLCDLHLHINGASEFTPVWLHSLAHPETTHRELCKALQARGNRVHFFLHQLRTDTSRILHRLRTAAAVRGQLCRLLQTVHTGVPISNPLVEIDALLRGGKEYGAPSPEHPFRHQAVPPDAHAVQREGAMWLHALWILRRTRNHSLAVLLHLYLLLMHQHLRLLVHQPEQYGFDQFQYITQVGAREISGRRGICDPVSPVSRHVWLRHGTCGGAVFAKVHPGGNLPAACEDLERLSHGHGKRHKPCSLLRLPAHSRNLPGRRRAGAPCRATTRLFSGACGALHQRTRH